MTQGQELLASAVDQQRAAVRLTVQQAVRKFIVHIILRTQCTFHDVQFVIIADRHAFDLLTPVRAATEVAKGHGQDTSTVEPISRDSGFAFSFVDAPVRALAMFATVVCSERTAVHVSAIRATTASG